jgi:hydrogenase/urease accessory protein HupE
MAPSQIAARYLKSGAAIVLLVFGGVGPAAAHPGYYSTTTIVPESDRTFLISVSLYDDELGRMLADFKVQSTGRDRKTTEPPHDAAGEFVLSHIGIRGADGAACAGKVDPGPRDTSFWVLVVTHWNCGAVPGNLVYRADQLLQAMTPGSQEPVAIKRGTDSAYLLLDRAHPTLDLSAALPSLVQVITRYLLAGIEHILTGYDHIAFLAAIILWAQRPWPVVKIITAFTLSHSVTLSLAVLGIAALPSALTEAAIAASIVYVAVENFFSRDIGRRWRYAFLFGFIHGFGFASGLKEMGLPNGAVVPALAAFNLGVECGQVTIVLMFVPLISVVDRITSGIRSMKVVYGGSGVIACLGAYWFLVRSIL